MRQYNWLDQCIKEADLAIRTLLTPDTRLSKKLNPAHEIPESTMTPSEKKHVAGLMRVNHTGEVCAQALYQGQALTAELSKVKQQMANAAHEEEDHLAWCEARLKELNSKPSLFNPLWYGGSLLLGALAGLAGDKWSLGFVAETECQVTQHLEDHLGKLPAQDKKTEAILTQMQQEEIQHAHLARHAGGVELPPLIRKMMRTVSKAMIWTSYYI